MALTAFIHVPHSVDIAVEPVVITERSQRFLYFNYMILIWNLSGKVYYMFFSVF